MRAKILVLCAAFAFAVQNARANPLYDAVFGEALIDLCKSAQAMHVPCSSLDCEAGVSIDDIISCLNQPDPEQESEWSQLEKIYRERTMIGERFDRWINSWVNPEIRNELKPSDCQKFDADHWRPNTWSCGLSIKNPHGGGGLMLGYCASNTLTSPNELPTWNIDDCKEEVEAGWERWRVYREGPKPPEMDYSPRY